MKKNENFGKEMSKFLPLIIREFAKRQENIFSKGILTLPQVVILDLLNERGPCKMKELGENLNFTMSAITAIVDKMIDYKLVKRERSKKDRRVVKIKMLTKGKNSLRKINKARMDISNDIFSILTKREKELYLKMMKQVYKNLKYQKN